MDLMNIADRVRILAEIESPENRQRKAVSLRQFEIFNDRIHQYVIEHLEGQFSAKTVKEMPVISSINLARRIVKQEASIYRQEPKRTFFGVTPELQEKLQDLYEDLGWNDKFSSSNEYFKLQNQTHIQWVLKNGKLKPRILLAHHLDVIPDPNDPEVAMAYIISSFDKQQYLIDSRSSATGVHAISGQAFGSDGFNQMIADQEDYKEKSKRFIVWSKDYNFVMDSRGNILSPDVENQLGLVPICDISNAKDFEYWVRQGQSVSDFTIQFNAMLSDVANVVRLQGWGQAVFSGPEGMLPENMQIGPNLVLRLPIDPNNPVPTEFKYVTPNADIAGSMEFLKMNLSMFMSSRGIDPKTVTTDAQGESFNSGLERLLSMISKFEASKDDMDVFRRIEFESFGIIKKYDEVYGGTEFMPDSLGIPSDAYVVVDFEEPEMIRSEKEELDLIQQQMELGLMSRLTAYMELNDVAEDEALKAIAEIDGETLATAPAQEVQAV